jgi:hypothetical protein
LPKLKLLAKFVAALLRKVFRGAQKTPRYKRELAETLAGFHQRDLTF